MSLTLNELCDAMYGIAYATVQHSKGLGLRKFDARQIREDVSHANRYVELAQTYEDALVDLDNARRRIKAAETLNQDLDPYTSEEWATKKLIANLKFAMLNVVANSRFYKDKYGRWIPRPKI